MSLTNFLSTVRTEGLSKSNRYSVLITPPASLAAGNPDLERISLFAESTELPGLSITTENLRIYGPSYIRPTAVEFGQTIDVTFLVDLNLKVRKLFEDWLNLVVDRNSYEVSYQSAYISEQIRFTLLDTNEVEKYSVTLKEAFPIGMSVTPISYSSNDYQRLSISFAYRKWESTFSNIESSVKPKYIKTNKDIVAPTPIGESIYNAKSPEKAITPASPSPEKSYTYTTKPV